MTPQRTTTGRIGIVAPLMMVLCFMLTAMSSKYAQQALQITSIACLAVAAAWLLARRQVRQIALSAYDWLLILCGSMSAVTSSLVGLDQPALYSLVFLICVFSSIVIVRSMSMQQLLSIFTATGILLIPVPLLLQSQELGAALALTISSIGLERFTPFNMHPNLAGFIYGGFAILMAIRTLQARRLGGRIMYALLSILSAVIVVAASSRAALLGLAIVAAILTWTFLSTRIVSRRTKWALLICMAATVIVLLTSGEALRYISGVLEIDSETRGVGSGASGRTDIWAAGIDLLLSSPARMLFGYGLRSSEPNITGFPVESSYINLALELGLIAGGALLLFHMVSAARMIAIGRSGRFGAEGIACLAFGTAIIFFLVHSLFNRYLVGVGNPMSVMGMLMMTAFNARFPMRRSTARGRSPNAAIQLR